MIRPNLRSREELIDFLQWKGSTHVIDNSNAKRTDQNGLKTMNRSKNERGENVLAKNTKNTSHKPNPGGHEVIMATIPITKTWFLHKSLNLWTSFSEP
jgi:hypothetical protein